jgi:RNA polymerase sigma-70 factor (ECF subfamily)
MIVKKLQEGDEGAFFELVEKYQDMVLKLAISFLHDYEEAEDTAQDVFVAVFENIGSFRNESNLKTWIYRIAINKSLNQQRKLKWKAMVTRIEDHLTWTNSTIENANPYATLVHKEQAQEIEKALEKIPLNQRTAFILHKYDQLSQEEIATIMNLSISAVESLIHRAKLNLQKILSHLNENK